jgi:hypothetical protein
MRYDTSTTEDGLPGSEGKFLACSFWLVSNLKLIGRESDALKLFERLLSLANDVGLLSEEYDTKRKRLVATFLRPSLTSRSSVLRITSPKQRSYNVTLQASLLIRMKHSSS